MACRDLLQLEWVKKGQLPAALAAKLRAARTARSFRAEALRRGRGLDNAALLLLLREVAEEDICEQLCSAEAKSVVCEHLRQHCTLQAGKLQLWLQAQAKSQTARWAAALVNSGAIGDLLEDMGEAFVRKKSSEEQAAASREHNGPFASLKRSVQRRGPMLPGAGSMMLGYSKWATRAARVLRTFLAHVVTLRDSEDAELKPSDPRTFGPLAMAFAVLAALLFFTADAYFSAHQPALEASFTLQSDRSWHLGGFCVGRAAEGEVASSIEALVEWRGARPLASMGPVYFVAFDGREDKWHLARQNWDQSSCEEKLQYATTHAKLGQDQDANHGYKVRIFQTMEIRDWHFALLSCGEVEEATIELTLEAVHGTLSVFQADTNFDISSCPSMQRSWWQEAVQDVGFWGVLVLAALTGSCSSLLLASCKKKQLKKMPSDSELVIGRPCAHPQGEVAEGQPKAAKVEASRARLAERRWRAEEAPQSLRMLFAVSQHGLVRISGHWAVGGREIVPERQASVHISAQMEVVLHWPRDDVFSSSNVQVEFISHQIWPPLPPKPAEGGLAVKRSDSRQHLSTRRHLASRSWGWPGRSASPAEEEERELWHIQCRVAWASETDTEDASVLETELGDLTWSSPVALPALERRRPDRDGPLRASTASAVGARVASLISSGPVGLLGHVGRVALQERHRMGLTFLGPLPKEQKEEEVAGSRRNSDADRSTPRSGRSHSEGSDRVTPFHGSRATTPPVIVTDVDYTDVDLEASLSLAPISGRNLAAEAQEAHGGSEKKLLKKQFFEMAATKPSEIPQLRKMLEEARQGAVDALDLAKMEQCLENCVALERAALGLLEAIQSGSIRQLESRLSIARELGLHSSAFPDETGAGVVQLATAKLEEEKAAAPLRLEAALHAFAKHAQQGVLGIGVIALQRCIDQARAAKIQDNVKLYKVEAKLHLLCERKREIALLKAAMAVEDAWLLKAATEECRQRFGELTFGVDLTLAKCQLEVWERTEDVSERRSRLETLVSIEEPDARAVHVEERARMALRAAMFHEPPQAELLRLAIARARRAKGTVPIAELQQAERALQEEREVEQALEQLRKAAAARDARALRRAIADCTDVGVEQRRLIPATVQLCDSLSELVQLGQRHGLSARDLTAERFQLRQDLAELQSGLRTVCRVRPPLPQELQDARLHAETAAPVLRRVDRHTLEVALSGGYATSDFSAVLGPESTQAEVFGELSGLAQSAMDGHNVALIACGPSGAGKSFTLCGTSEQPGLLPRILEELFALKAQLWRSDIAVDVQALEVVDDEPPRDLLRPPGSEEQPVHVRRQGRQGPGPSQALRCGPVRLAAATRRAALRELKDLVQEIWSRPGPRQAVLILHITRRNRHTGAAVYSQLLVADLAPRSPDHTLSRAVAASVARRRRSMGLPSGSWSPRESLPEPNASGQVLTELLQDCFSQTAARAALLVCFPPTALDRHKVLGILEGLGLRQSLVQTAETRAESQPSAPPEIAPRLPSALLQQMAGSPVQSPNAARREEAKSKRGSGSDSESLEEEDL
ncbi:unnamed protein product [Effrenium voratum]|nr:unnamed protein product [Effrenium voratum]